MNEGVHRERFAVGSSHARLVSIPTIERRGAHPRVAVGIRDLRFHQEVLDWIERDARIDVIGAASDPESFVRLRAQHAVDVCVAFGVRQLACHRGLLLGSSRWLGWCS